MMYSYNDQVKLKDIMLLYLLKCLDGNHMIFIIIACQAIYILYALILLEYKRGLIFITLCLLFTMNCPFVCLACGARA